MSRQFRNVLFYAATSKGGFFVLTRKTEGQRPLKLSEGESGIYKLPE
jgi:hypothetical protein